MFLKHVAAFLSLCKYSASIHVHLYDSLLVIASASASLPIFGSVVLRRDALLFVRCFERV